MKSTSKDTWVDITSYSQNDKVRTPKTWELRIQPMTQIIVTRLHGVPDLWFLKCYRLGIETVQLQSTDLEKAKQEAVTKVRQLLTSLITDLDRAVGPKE